MVLKSPLLEENKRLGVHYALTADAVELPIVDVTHPVFALSVTAPEQAELVEAFKKETQQLERLPKLIRTPLLRFLLRKSVLARGIRQSQGSFMANAYARHINGDVLERALRGVRDDGLA